jgi:hypothetical protein
VTLSVSEPTLFALFFFEGGLWGHTLAEKITERRAIRIFSNSFHRACAYVVLRMYIYNKNRVSLSLSLSFSLHEMLLTAPIFLNRITALAHTVSLLLLLLLLFVLSPMVISIFTVAKFGSSKLTISV